MSQGLVMAGLAAAALYLLSPKLRRSVNGFLEQLAAEERRKSQLLEAERRAAIISDAFKSFEFQSEPTSELPPAPPAKLAFRAVAEPDARWREVIIPPSILLILGKRGSGKSALAYRLLELFRYQLTPYVVGAPAQAAKLLPDWIGTVPSLDDLPPDCIALVDEAYLHYHSRRSMAQESTEMSQQLNLSRQRNQTLIFVSQEARQVDRNIASSASVIVFKEMGMLQPEFDRPELRKLVEQAGTAMAGLGKEIKKWAFVYSPDADQLGLLESHLPSFWRPGLSKLFAAGAATPLARSVAKMTAKEKAKRAKELKAKGYNRTMIMKELGVSKATIVNYLKDYPYRPG